MVKKNKRVNDLAINIIENIQLGMHIYHLEDINDDKTLRMIAANPASEKLTGVKPEDVIGKTLDENFPGLREKGVPQAYAEVVRTQKPYVIEDIFYTDERVIAGAFEVKAFPLPDNQVCVAFENIIKRKKAELELKAKTEEIGAQNEEMAAQNEEFLAINEELQESHKIQEELKNKSEEREAYLNSLLKVAPIGIGVVNSRVIHYINELMTQITGYEKNELLNKNSRILYPNDEEYNYVGKIKYEQINKYGTGTVETKWKCKNGHIKEILLSSTPIDPDDLTKGVTFTALDITNRKKAEDGLNESKLMLQAVMDTIPVRVFWKDTTSKYLGCNKRFAIDAGFKNPEDIIGKTDTDLIWKKSANRFLKSDNEVLNNNISILNYEENQEIEGKADGWVKKSKIPLKDEKGKIIVILGTYEDITNIKKSKDKLKEREQTIRYIQEGVSSAVGEKFFETIILKLGKTLKADYTLVGELAGKKMDKIKTISLCYRGRIISNIEYELKGSPCEQVISNGKCRYPRNVSKLFPNDLLLKDLGIEGYIGFPLFNKENKPIGIIVSMYKNPIDDSRFGETILKIFSTRTTNEIERLKSEIALKQSEEQYKKLADATFEGIVYTHNGIVIEANQQIANMLGYKMEELINLEVKRFVHPEDSELVISKIKKDIQEPYEHRSIKKDGSVIYVEVRGKTILHHGKTMRLTAIRDITKRKLIELDLKDSKHKAEESDRLKSAFLANMSHEIRTPMNGILGFVGLLNNPNISSEKREKYLNIINASSEQLLGIINDIIEISKIESGQVKVIHRKTNINNILDNLFSQYDLDKKLKNKENIKLSVSKPLENNDCEILTDDIKLKQILTNLLSNAIKFTEKGEIEFGYHVKKEFLEFYVKDTGIGISKDKHQIIFERFRQEDESQTRKFGGTGLGLAISKALSELLGGKIWIESKKNNGAAFIFNIPFRKIDSKNFYETDNKELVNYNWKNKKILIVEDTDFARQFLEEALEDTQVNIITAINGKEAIKKYHEIPAPDLILMDIQLPDINGFDVTRQIKQYNPEIPIIAQTAYGMSGDKEKAITAGCDDYISKPIIIKELLNKIHHFLNK